MSTKKMFFDVDEYEINSFSTVDIPVCSTARDIDIAKAIWDNDESTVDSWITSTPDVNNELPGNTRVLHLAAECAKQKMMSKFLDAGADSRVTIEPSRRTALHTVCYYGRNTQSSDVAAENVIQCVELLLPKMSAESINAPDKENYTALHYAAQIKDKVVAFKISLLLLENGATPAVQAKFGMTSAHLAVFSRNEGLLQEMMRVDVNCVFIPNDLNETALHCAVKAGVLCITKKILNKIKDPGITFDLTMCVDKRCGWYGGGNLLHYAARGGSSEIAKILIAKGIPIDPEDYEPSPIEEAVKYGSIEVAQTILNGKDGKLPRVTPRLLIKIVKAGFKTLAVAIMERPDWHCILRGVKHYWAPLPFKQECSNSLREMIKEYYWSTIPFRENCTTPFREMIRHLPEVAKLVLDKCVVEGDNSNTERCNIFAYNYEFIEDFKHYFNNSSDDDKNTSSNIGYGLEYVMENKHKQWGPEEFSKQNHCLSIMVQYQRLELLNHPFVKLLLQQKWISYGFFYYILNVIFYVLFLLFLTSFALVVRKPLVAECQSATVSNYSENSSERQVYTCVTAAMVILMALLKIVFEISQFLDNRLDYFTDWMNWIEIVLYTCSIFFAAMPNWTCSCVFSWQWKTGVVAVCLAWVNALYFTALVPYFGVYVHVITEICKSYFKVTMIAVLLVTAYGITFYMIFWDSLVQRLPTSVMKTLTMSIGESNYNTTSQFDSDANNAVNELSAAYSVWITFLIIVPLLFFNMLVGVAVGDVDKALKEAKFRTCAFKVNIVLSAEAILRIWFPTWIGLKSKKFNSDHYFPALLKRRKEWWPKKFFVQCYNFVKNNPREVSLECYDLVKKMRLTKKNEADVDVTGKQPQQIIKEDNAEVMKELKHEFAGVKQEIKQNVVVVKKEIAEMKQEVAQMKQEIAAVKQNVGNITKEIIETRMALRSFQQVLLRIAEKCGATEKTVGQ